MKHLCGQLSLLLCCTFLLLVAHDAALGYEAKPYPLLQPVSDRTQLQLMPEGLEILRSIEGPVALVVVIGPYRSGKSFLLNQLLKVPCGEGFGVGHTRDTQTKGIWLWGKPKQLKDGQGKDFSVVYVDTEGFEGAGKANSYDDRIFAISALMSSLLIYNLPETIRESDVEKLSFAVELADGFFSKVEGDSVGTLDPGSMLWLIQRDFLEGKTVQELVDWALAPVPDPHHDKEIQQLNKIRQSLSRIARNSTGYSLKQPHLERTHLCELNDTQLDPVYVQQRDRLRGLVTRLTQPKALGGRILTGPRLADLVERMVKAVNSQEIPNVSSMIKAFNQELISRCLAVYTKQLQAVKLPVEEKELEAIHQAAEEAALDLLQDQLLGREAGTDIRKMLLKQIKREHSIRQTENRDASNQACQKAEMECELTLDRLLNMSIPMLHFFEDGYSKCFGAFDALCKGPAKADMKERLQRAWSMSSAQFRRDYNDRLYTGLLISSLACVVVFRFLVKLQLLELLSWAGFIFLQVYPRLYGGTNHSMYSSKWWVITVQLWEVVMFLLVGFPGSLLVWVVLILVMVFMLQRRRKQQLRARKRRSSTGKLDTLEIV